MMQKNGPCQCYTITQCSNVQLAFNCSSGANFNNTTCQLFQYLIILKMMIIGFVCKVTRNYHRRAEHTVSASEMW